MLSIAAWYLEEAMLVFPDFQYLAEIPENTLRHIYVYFFYEVIFFFLENSQDWKFRLEKYVYFKDWAKYYTQIVSNYCGILWVCLLPCTFAHRWCCFHMRKSGLVSWTYSAVLGVDSCLAATNVSTNSFSACSVFYMLICFVF